MGRNPSGNNGHLDSRRPEGNGGNMEQLQHQFRQMAMESKYNTSATKDWQDGFRALLPNVNVSFGALPAQQQQQQQHQPVPAHLLDGVMDSGSSRFNNLQTSNSNSNMLNDLQSAAGHQHQHLTTNSHMDRAHHHHQSIRQNSGKSFSPLKFAILTKKT